MNSLADLNGLLITNPTNIRYLTGFVGMAPEEREAFALLIKSKIYLFVTPLYKEAARKLSNNPINQFPNNPIKILEVSREHPIAKELAALTQKLSIKKVGFEETDLTVSEYQKLKQTLKGVTLVPTKDRIEKLRMIKRSDEIASIKSACKVTDQCFDDILGKLKPGITEAEIAWEIQTFFRNNNAETAFSPIVAFNKNSSQPHYLSTNHEPLTMNSLVLLDFGARVNGYCSDMTRVIFVGKPSDEQKRAYQTVLEAQTRVVDAIQQYYDNTYHHSKQPQQLLSGASLDRFARTIIKKAGFPPCPHSLGHNVGLDIHEGPRLSDKKEETLLPGMIFSIEPGVYVEGQYGIRIEDLVRLKKDGIEILTKSSKEIIIL